jgi:hypothetical protein
MMPFRALKVALTEYTISEIRALETTPTKPKHAQILSLQSRPVLLILEVAIPGLHYTQLFVFVGGTA